MRIELLAVDSLERILRRMGSHKGNKQSGIKDTSLFLSSQLQRYLCLFICTKSDNRGGALWISKSCIKARENHRHITEMKSPTIQGSIIFG